MDRRDYLKRTLALGGYLSAPAGVVALVGCSGAERTPGVAAFDGHIMGTSYSLRLGADMPHHRIGQLANEVHATLQHVDNHMSTWRPQSELSVFNDSYNRDWQPLTPATIQVLAAALKVSATSRGAFDATVGPLVDLWGFGAGATVRLATATARKPASRAIIETLSRVGFDDIEIDVAQSAARKANTHTRLDLSGIAKGHAVDRVASLLQSRGWRDYLIEIGGELKAAGNKPDGSPWRVAIERPVAQRGDVFRVIDLQDQAIATSGDYRNFFADKGQRYSHSIDPRSGMPVSHELASVSVVADSTMRADALSTALMILGPDEAMSYATKHNVAAQMILKSGAHLKEICSPAFESCLT